MNTEKELKIQVPEGYEIDTANSTFECIKFKPIQTWYGTHKDKDINGYEVSVHGDIFKTKGKPFMISPTEKHARFIIAANTLFNIQTNDTRFGGFISDEEWKDITIPKYGISSWDGSSSFYTYKTCGARPFFTFHTKEQAELFLKEYIGLLEQFYLTK